MIFGRRVAGSFVAQLVLLVAGLVATIAIARVLGPTGTGGYGLAVQLGGFAVLIGGLGIEVGTIYFSGRRTWPPERLATVLLEFGIAWGAVVTLLTAAAAFLLRNSVLHGLAPSVLVPAVAIVPVVMVFRYLRSFLLGQSRLLEYNGSNIVLAVLTTTFVVGAALLLHAGLVGAVWGSWTANFVAACLVVALVRPPLRSLFQPGWLEILRQLLPFGLKAQFANVLQFFSYRLDLFIVNAFLGIRQAGIYLIATMLAESIWYLPNAVSLVLGPRVAAAEVEDADRFTPLICRATVLISALAAITLAILAPILIRLLVGPAFLPALLPLWLLLPGVVALALDKPLAGYQLGQGRPQISFYVVAVATPVSVAGYLLLIPAFGIAGAALGSTISYVVTSAAEVFFLHRVSTLRVRDLVVPKRGDFAIYRALLGEGLRRLSGTAAEGIGTGKR